MATACRLATRSTASTAGRSSLTRSRTRERTGPAAAVGALHRTAGNAAVARLLRESGRVRGRDTDQVRTTFDDCPTNAKDVIRERTQTAQAWVDYSIRQIDSVLADPSKAAPDVHALLRKHFHLGEGKNADRAIQDAMKIRGRFAKIRASFTRTIPFECESSCKANTAGYVTDYWIFGKGDIHVCPAFFALGHGDQVSTIVHEMAHKYLDLSDKAYVWEAKYSTLTTDAAISNAEAYGEFVKDI
jgi:hypothetical protein